MNNGKDLTNEKMFKIVTMEFEIDRESLKLNTLEWKIILKKNILAEFLTKLEKDLKIFTGSYLNLY